jgi:hypothetical protein
MSVLCVINLTELYYELYFQNIYIYILIKSRLKIIKKKSKLIPSGLCTRSKFPPNTWLKYYLTKLFDRANLC